MKTDVEVVINSMKKAIVDAVELCVFAQWVQRKYPHIYKEWQQHIKGVKQ